MNGRQQNDMLNQRIQALRNDVDNKNLEAELKKKSDIGIRSRKKRRKMEKEEKRADIEDKKKIIKRLKN